MVILIFANASARVLKTEKVLVGRGAIFLTGTAASLVAPLHSNRSRAPTTVSRGGYDHGVVAAASVSQGVRGCNHHFSSNHHRAVLWFPEPTASCMESGSQMREHRKEQLTSRADAVREGLFELAHENARIEALHV